MSRWAKLWAAIVKWWKNEPEPEPPKYESPNLTMIKDARKMLAEYADIYQRRTGVDATYGSVAAETVLLEGHKRSPSTESEVRVLAILCERLVRQLEEEVEREERSRHGGDLPGTPLRFRP